MDNNKYAQLKAKIRGPVFPIITPFKENQEVDHEALNHYVDFLVEAGAPVILLTVGTSRFNLLTRSEIFAVNETVVKAAAGRTITVVAGPGPNRGSTLDNIEFTQHAKSIGADAILILYPERWYGDDPVIGFFHSVADSTDIGIMVHAVPMRDGFGGVKALKYLDAPLLGKIVEKENVIGVKEENGEREIFEGILKRFNANLPIIGAGGAMRRFQNDHKLGSYTYLVGIGSFKPKLAIEFYQAVMRDNQELAESIASRYEDPYFKFAVQLGWHRALKETLHQLGLMPPFERSPLNRINEQQRTTLRSILISCGWLPEV